MARKRHQRSETTPDSEPPARQLEPDASHDTGASEAPTEEQFFTDIQRTSNLIWTPVVGYTLAAILAVPAALYVWQLLAPAAAPSVESPAAPQAADSAPFVSSANPDEPPQPRIAARSLLRRYEEALRARDMRQLEAIWRMDDDDRKDYRELFNEARLIGTLIDIQNTQLAPDDTVLMSFVQVLTVVRGDDEYSARGPIVYDVKVQRDDGFDDWVITELKPAE